MLPIRRAFLTSYIRRAFLQPPRQHLFPAPRFYSASLEPKEYHRVADETMDKLTSELENLLEENDVAESDIEYSVCRITNWYADHVEWSLDFEAGKAWNIRDQQTASKSTNMA